MVSNCAYGDMAVFTQNDSYSNILTFGCLMQNTLNENS